MPLNPKYASDTSIARLPHSDPGLEEILSQIDRRQAKSTGQLDRLDPEALAFQLMRQVPRKHWKTPWPQIQGATSQNPQTYPFNVWSPGLKKLTPEQTILQLFNLPGVIQEESGRRRAGSSQTQ